jgi:neuropeptide Y receptor
MCCLAVPFTPISAYANAWHLGRMLCHLVPMSLGTSGKIFFLFSKFLFSFFIVYVSTLTSLAIAVDRYFVIVHPFRSRMRLGVCILLIIVIWIVGISISLPLAIYMRFDGTNCKVN